MYKKLLALFCAFLLLLSSSITVFADGYGTTYDLLSESEMLSIASSIDSSLALSKYDTLQYFVVYTTDSSDSDYQYTIAASSQPFVATSDMSVSSYGTVVVLKVYSLSTDSRYKYNGRYYTLSKADSSLTHSIASTSNGIIYLYSSHDIYYDSGQVFYRAPAVPVLPKIAQTLPLVGVTEQVKIIAPIIIVCLVGYRALRTALSTLKEILFRA